MVHPRPSAFEVSFPDETGQLTEIHGTSASSYNMLKRKNDIFNGRREAKRQQLPKDAYYKKKRKECFEDANLVVIGEDPFDGAFQAKDDKPVRQLYDFVIFDPKHQFELASLHELKLDDGVDRQFEGAGFVRPYFMTDEDDGQEEEELETQYLRISPILQYFVDFKQENEPFYIETEFAWYILRMPEHSYVPFYKLFYTPQRIAQRVVSWALGHPEDCYNTFLDIFTSWVDIFGQTYSENLLRDSVPVIQAALRSEPSCEEIICVPFIKSILQNGSASYFSASLHQPTSYAKSNWTPKHRGTGNIDLAVLKSENQNPTCVTPRIGKLAEGLFHEEIVVIGRPPSPIMQSKVDSGNAKAAHHLRNLLSRSRKRKKINHRKLDRLSLMLDIYRAVDIDGEQFSIGDIVIIPNHKRISEAQLTKEDHKVAEYFWFGKIIYIVMESETAHIQWFYHGCQTIIAELAHPQELFLAELCSQHSLHDIVGKVIVHLPPGDATNYPPGEYFCKFMHDPKVGTYTSLDIKFLELCNNEIPPDNCPVCPLLVKRDQDNNVSKLTDETGQLNGIVFGGANYHLNDFVLHRANAGPAHVGYITKFQFAKASIQVTLKVVGRIVDLTGILPKSKLKDERHLYLTNEEMKIDVKNLLRVIYVPCVQSIPSNASLEDWLNLSCHHFYISYSFPRLVVKSWEEKKRIAWKDLQVCTLCYEEHLKESHKLYDFLAYSKQHPLTTLDLFGGVGSFSQGLAEGSGCLEVTHAIEISPSAVKTFQHNWPSTMVFNQCVNEILRYTIKLQQDHQIKPPTQIFDDKTQVPNPPKPGEIQVIIAGFPCQTHSSLNIYKTTEDRKSNLILTTLSYMDYYSPLFGYFENVPGFLRFALNATQASQHKVVGGIEMGGLKFLLHALVDMRYQVRFGLLQAAHYGTPQRRVRFFLVAAKDGQILPQLPQPTHDFPETMSLDIKCSDKETISPIRVSHGTALHSFVSIDDAISDLPPFDWKHPKPGQESEGMRKKREKRALVIPAYHCKITEPYSGIAGRIGYLYQPKTRYQQKSRLVETTDLQQYTKCLLPEKVERQEQITPASVAWGWDCIHFCPLTPPHTLASSNIVQARMYGRLSKDTVFPTTVTNMDPTAKQSQVLHPSCHRMFTVRELARSQGFPDSFVFSAIDTNVVTMHRQIGNAVPLPVARALGCELRDALFSRWRKINLQEETNAMSID